MAKAAVKQTPRKQYLDVKYTLSDGVPLPYRIDADEEEYPVEVLRSKEIMPGKWRYGLKSRSCIYIVQGKIGGLNKPLCAS